MSDFFVNENKFRQKSKPFKAANCNPL